MKVGDKVTVKNHGGYIPDSVTGKIVGVQGTIISVDEDGADIIFEDMDKDHFNEGLYFYNDEINQ